MMHKIAKTENIFHFVCDHREIQSLQDESAELRERLKIAEADLAKAITGEKKASDEVSGHVIIMWIMKMTVISIGNRMNLLVHFMIYGHERCFESSQNCTSHRRVQYYYYYILDFFIIWCSNLALPQCFHGNFSILHSITSIALYNLFMHSSLTNQKRDILLSI